MSQHHFVEDYGDGRSSEGKECLCDHL